MILKDWECVEVKTYKEVAETIKEWEENGWNLHTYSTAGTAGAVTSFINHYLLFEKETSYLE